MSQTPLDLGTLLGGGVSLLRRRLGAVLVWTLIYAAGIAGAHFMVRQIILANPSGEGGVFSIFLVQLLFALIEPVLLTAAMRALLRPRETEFASLDAGVDELRVIGIFLVFSIFFAIINLISGFLLGGFVRAAPTQAVALVALLVPLLAAACLYARLSLAFPLALLRKRILLEEAWALSAGKFWSFFLAYAIIAVGVILVGLAISAVTNWAAMAAVFTGQGVGQVQDLRIIVPVDALTILAWTLHAVQSTLAIVFTAGVMISGARSIIPDTDELTRTFS